MSGPFGSSQWMYSSGEAVEGQSLRFNDNDSAYLSWTPLTAGTLTKFTFSAWVKRGNLSSSISDIKAIVGTNNGGSNFRDVLRFTDDNGTDILSFQHTAFSSYTLYTSAVFRDVSAWYHIVLAVDTTQATASDRVNIYVNGEAQTLNGTYPPQNNNTQFGRNCNQYIGARSSDGSSVIDYFDGYISEVNFIDGTQLDPTSFGETDANGQWVPKTDLSGLTYGTNGFYLPFTNDYEVEGFNTVTWTGNGGTQYIGGVGFEPDFVWAKNRNSTYYHIRTDSVRGAEYALDHTTSAEVFQPATGYMSSFDTDGFTVTSGSSNSNNYNGSGLTYVAWTWDMGTGSAVSNTDGSITSSVKASQTYGQSIVSYTGNGTAGATIGHGLSSAPEIIIVKNRDSLTNWFTYVSEIGAGNSLILNTTNASYAASILWNNTDPTTSVFSVGTATETNGSGNDIIAYCFHSVAGYSDFGSYTGNGSSTGPTVTTGFKPAFVMVKRTDSTGDWHILDNTRSPYGELDNYLYPNTSDAEYAGNNDGILITDTTFQLSNSYSALNASGGTYIYMAFADKREAAFWLDQSGNNNDWTNNNMQESDISLDSPTNNFSTFNPIDPHGGNASTLSEGNLKASSEGSNSWSRSTYWIESGAYYCEILSQSSSGQHAIQGNYGNTYFSWTDNGQMVINGTSVGTYSSHTSGDIIGLAIDRDANTVKFYKNNTLVYTGTSLSSGAIKVGSFFAPSSGSAIGNFGQDSSFAGNKTAQGNQDANGKGDFYYEPPAGYLALCTDNLPDPAIADGSEHFNTVLYTGDGTSNRTISGVGFQPDLTWLKGRSTAVNHRIADSLRQYSSGAYYLLSSNLTATEVATFDFSAFTSDGFTISDAAYDINDNTTTYAAWNWLAGNGTSSNTDGSITSTVSVNQKAGFSIVSYTGNGTNPSTIGHGLGTAPKLVITKNRDAGPSSWVVYHASTGATQYLLLNTTGATATDVNAWNNTSPTSSVFTVGSYSNASGNNHIAYCFAEVEGYSKFGSYTGNGSSDGPFVYTGFRPAFVIIKKSSATGEWVMFDNERSGYNVDNDFLYANATNSEYNGATYVRLDLVSNGFKMRDNSSDTNGSGSTYIYMAFAESPFKYSNAR